jgi:Ca2+/H+ antiporter, TMEM165/GDT1 family
MNVVALIAVFLASAVEWVEALTIVLAVGITRGWRSSLTGVAAALGVLLALVLVFVALGAGAGRYVPLDLARTLIGVFLLLFGIRWLHKAILRSSGLKSLHDEDEAFAETRRQLAGTAASGRLDYAAVATSFNGTLLEGLEVVFIVIALAGLSGLPAASIGALAALVAVAVVGVFVRAPLSRVPENTMKYTVGVMLTAFGTFFAGEGLGVAWWNGDLSLLPLIAGYAMASLLIVQLLKRPLSAPSSSRALAAARAAVAEVWGLFVGEGPLAIATVAVLLAVGLFTARTHGNAELAGLLLALGVVGALLIGLSSAFGQARRAPARAEASGPAPEPAPEPVAESVGAMAAERGS